MRDVIVVVFLLLSIGVYVLIYSLSYSFISSLIGWDEESTKQIFGFTRTTMPSFGAVVIPYFMIYLFFISLCCFIQTKKYFSIAIIAISFAGILFSLSRCAILVFIFTLFVYVICNFRRSIRSYAFFIAVSILLLFGFLGVESYKIRFDSFNLHEARGVSLRFASAETAWQIFKEVNKLQF